MNMQTSYDSLSDQHVMESFGCMVYCGITSPRAMGSKPGNGIKGDLTLY